MATLSHLSTALSLSKTLTPLNSSSLSLFFPIPSAFDPPIPDSSRPDVSLSPPRCLTPHALRPPIMTSTLAIYPVRCPTSGSRSPFFSATTSIAALHSAPSTPPGIPTPLSISKSGSRLVNLKRENAKLELLMCRGEDFENFWSECPWEEDLKYAKVVCNQVDVPLEVGHLTDEYWNNVKDVYVYHYEIRTYGSIFQVSCIVEKYRCGCTPNLDVLCNTRIKFGM
ncbi:hypothetical protein RHGRI_002012 [Rhododendron griersonianum]|uniref:SRCR domain-containing protein n=1 Tax=Rhododendron griersonianum TaxID=479676 RepID=A0AAV6LPF9_9ERIC|nr:hypothetical protein RHGRI_002012 [Rhododendron griersonianum]